MITDRLIVCIGSSWDYDPTSKHHIMRMLSRHNRILWINYHGTRCPEANAVDLKDVFGALHRVTKGLKRESESISQLTPLVIPGASSALLQRLHQRLLIFQIRRAIAKLQGETTQPIQVWSFAPDVPYLVGALGEERFVYYCVDEYRAFDGFDAKKIADAEDELIDRADWVVTSSETLRSEKARRRPDVMLVRHGVDFDHFATAWRDKLPLPTDLSNVPRPMFGFFGVVHHWVDRRLLAEVARLRPSYSFVLIGECKVDVSELRTLPNVYLLGRKPYAQLPAYAAAFDAAMLLFARNEMTRHVNPVKLSEYLAAGLPVISTPLPEAKRIGGPVVMADTAQEFALACDAIVASPKSINREQISHTVSDASWHTKVEHLSDLVMNGVSGDERTRFIGEPTCRSCA